MSDHRLTEYGTTTCPVQRVRAFVDEGVCSACGATVKPNYPPVSPKGVTA